MSKQRFSTIRIWVALVAFAGVAVYLGTLGHGFVFDDQIVIVRNEHVRSLSALPQIFTSTEWAGGGRQNSLFRPLTSATYAFNYALAGLSPWSYHLVNVLLHGLVSALVVLLGLSWGLPVAAAGAAGLLFAVHPIHVEAVANVVGRKELLAALFLIAMMLAHRRALGSGGPSILLPTLAYAAAMLSKETGIVGIGLVAISDTLGQGEDASRAPVARRRRVGLYVGYAAVATGYLALRATVVGPPTAINIPFLDNPLAAASTAVRWMTGITVIGKGLLLQLVPLHQSPDYSFDAIPVVRSALDWRFLVSGAVLAAWFLAGVRLRRTVPAVLLGAGWYALTILPASNLLFPSGTIFGERLLYVPSMGFLIAVTVLVAPVASQPGRHRRIVEAAFASVVLLSCVATVRYAAAWQDEFSLFTVAARHAPASTKAHHKLGEALLAAGRIEEAVSEGRRAVEIAPSNTHARVFLADALRAAGKPAEAERELQQALELGPDADALYAAGRLKRDVGLLNAAEALWRQAVEVEPGHAASLADLGTLALVRGDTASALSFLERATRSNPAQANAWYNLALIRETQGDLAAARAAYERFVESAGPEYAEVVADIERRLAVP